MKIKALQNFVHAPSKRSFTIGAEFEVTEKSAAEFVKAGLAVEMKPEQKKPVKANHEKYVDMTPSDTDLDREDY